MKLYALRVVEDEDSLWDTYAYSHNIEKLAAVVKGVQACWFIGASDVTNNKYEVRYTDKGIYPRYSIVEVPFIV